MRRIEIIGNLGRDAEYKMAGSTTVLNFSVGTRGAKRESDTVWVRCAVFGKRADVLREFLTKGKQVFCRGPVEVKAWSANGKSGIDVEMVCDEIELLGGGAEKRETAAASEYVGVEPPPF